MRKAQFGSGVEDIVRNYEYLYGQLGDWRSYWQDISNFCLPRKAWITTIKVMGQQLNYNFLYDSRAILALKKSAAGFHSNLTNPATRWFSLGMLNEKFMQSGAVQRYFKECDDVQYAVMNNSNFNNTAMEFYTDILGFGTSTILSEEDERQKVRYTSIPVEQTIIEEDAAGYVCAFYRPFKLTAIQASMRWGDRCSPDIKKALNEDQPFKKFDFIHYVGKRGRRDVSKMDSVNMEWESLWIVKQERWKIDESGFAEFPYAVARWWKHSDDPYGYGPAADALASVKTVNAQKRTVLRAAMKQSDPATMSPYKFWIQPFNLNPAAQNYYDASKFKPEQFAAIENRGNLPITVEIMQMEQDLIDQCFYVHLFENLMNVTKEMTVPEVQRRIAEALSLVSPVIGHVLDEGFSPLLLRTYGILDRQLMFPPAPKEIQGKEMNIIYLSPMAKAQRGSELNGLASWTEFVTSITQGISPDARDKVDSDFVTEYSAELLGVNPKVLREQKKVEEIRARNQQLQAQQLQMQNMEQASKIGKNIASAKKDVQPAGK